MARPPRFFLPGQPQHVVQRGNNRQTVFFRQGDYFFYRDCLREACARYGCALHAYVLMPNHVHLLLSPKSEDALPRTMQLLGMRYTQFINARCGRTGTLWQARYRPTLVDTDEYFLTCSRYIELNPVRAGLAEGPDRYAWSSYAANAGGLEDALITPHPLYESLGSSSTERAEAYRKLFDDAIQPATLAEIRDSTQHGWPLGTSRFRDAVEALTRRRTEPLPRGGYRPGAGRRPLINSL